ncbi:MAG: hypothetical protein E7317_12940 [Clostridiales bacterium]|nr:hypothetical protein [Clostridiales bacterium]
MDENMKNLTSMDDEEIEQAKAEAKKAQDLFTLKFRKPFTYESVEYDELQFDFESLTGNDSLQIEAEINRTGQQVAVPAFSGEFIVRMAARACTAPIGHDAMRLMSMRDWHRLRARARNFLMASEL